MRGHAVLALFDGDLLYHAAGQDRPDQAFAEVPRDAPRLVLLHEPATFERLPAGVAPLALAGHTHSGQGRVPGLPDLAFGRAILACRPWPNYRDGWIKGFGQTGNHLYVNRGTGFSKVPMRFGCVPELTWLTLKRV